MSHDRVRVEYEVSPGADGDAAEIARAIAYEQTAELPAACVSPELTARVVGRVRDVRPLGDGRSHVTIDYDPAETLDAEAGQLLNLLFGNISLLRGIRIVRVGWPASLTTGALGPRHGIEGLRRLCGDAARRPLVCGALKPMGLAPERLAAIAAAMAAGGADLVKDDHGLADQAAAPFEARVRACADAVAEANARHGTNTLYAPNVVGAGAALERRVAVAQAAGCRALLLSPLVVGPQAVREIRRNFDLAILAHPALAGAYFHPDHGIAPEILLGQIFRLLGADASIYPNVGGRFPLSLETCAAIDRALREPLGDAAPAFPMPGGGIDAARAPQQARRSGPDTILLIGGSLYASGDLTAAVARLRAALGDGRSGRPL